MDTSYWRWRLHAKIIVADGWQVIKLAGTALHMKIVSHASNLHPTTERENLDWSHRVRLSRQTDTCGRRTCGTFSECERALLLVDLDKLYSWSIFAR